MPKQNPYLIKENYKQVEEVSYLEEKETVTPEEQAKIVDKLIKNEIPSYEEFMKTYQEEERVIDSYYYEVDSHGDIRVVKCYGPGNETSKEVVKVVGKTVISVGAAGAILATGGAAAPVVLGAALASGGKLAEVAGKELDCEFLEWIGDTASDTGINMLTGSLAGATSSVPNNLARHIATATDRGGPVVAALMRAAKEGYDNVSEIMGNCEKAARFYHAFHRDDGISYKSDCPICNK